MNYTEVNYHILSDTVVAFSEVDFDRLLLEAIDEGLSSLGESPKRAMYHHLEEDFHIVRPQIPHNIQDFNRVIEDIFQDGAAPLKILMMGKIHDKIGGSLNWIEDDRLIFTRYVTALKQNFLKEKRGP